MVSGIRFLAASGAMGNTIASLYANGIAAIGLEIFQFEIGANGSPNRLGFFGSAGAPNSAVIVGQYQDRSHVTNDTGADLGQLINGKFTGASSVEHSGVPFTAAFTEIPSESGTILCRFTEPNTTAVITQSATFRAVDFGAPGPATGDTTGSASGVPDITNLASNITIQAMELANTDGYAGNTAWTEISDGGAALALQDQATETHVHDFHLILSGSPAVAGRKTDFGYFMQLEFL